MVHVNSKDGRTPFWFTMSGGEPFLRKDLVELCASAFRHCRPAIINIPTNGLLAFYPFSGDALDASGNDNNATLLGGSTASTFLTIGDNAADYVRLPHTMLQGVGDFTISFWARIAVLHASGQHCVISGARSDAGNNELLVCFMPPTNAWVLYVTNQTYAFGPSQVMRDLDWHHVVALRKGNIGCLYLDNAQMGDSVTVSTTALNLATGGLLLGQDQDRVGGEFQAIQSLAGDLDNLRIYNRALTAAEIYALFVEKGWGG